jgi:mannonate dehydratase
MKHALGAVRFVDDKILRFAAQIDVDGVVLNTPQNLAHVEREWSPDDLRPLVDQVRGHGLEVLAIENTPLAYYRDAIIGGPLASEQTAAYCRTIASIGEVGVPTLGFHWMANEVWRSDRSASGRGGARVTSFRWDDSYAQPTFGRVFTAAELWSSFRQFLNEVVPAAERAGVTLALHPDDPPVAEIGGMERIFSSAAGLQRALDEASSDHFKLELCLGTISSMGPGAERVLDHFARQDKVAYVHLRDVIGHVPNFDECFLGEGNFDPVEVISILQRYGFNGFVCDDHVPLLDDDPAIGGDWVRNEYAYVGRAYSNGVIQGLLRALGARPRAAAESVVEDDDGARRRA